VGDRVERKLAIANRRGLHARASASFVRLASSFDARIEVRKDGLWVDGLSIMGLMLLTASQGETITIRAVGPDAAAAVEALAALVDDRFGEDREEGD